MVGIDDRGFWVVAHTAGAQQVVSKILLFDRRGPLLHGVGSIEQLQDAVAQKSAELEIVGMILVGHSQGRQAPGFFQIGIQRKTVALHRQGSSVRQDFQSARVIVRQGDLDHLGEPGEEVAIG